MSKVADQVATLERDLDAALATIDQLTAANSALVSANASLQRDNVELQLAINDMKHYVDDTREMADSLASSALEMLRASRRHVGPAEPAPLSVVEKQARINAAHEALQAAELAPVVSLDAKIAALPEKWPEQKAVAEIMQGDSGDETDICGYRMPTIEEQDAGNANAIASDTTPLAPNKFEPMPIFLQRDTPFEDKPRLIFG
ncbi:hypothetical protein [Bradyrhizobium liaoningense]|uniref:hypothetical protein n=1 Tax=Bradyrhizobium liaoningense TaxID=43992 RepID=UPI0004B33FF3|nr:hypothetical protein [Bradyrhizobium liaoningense]